MKRTIKKKIPASLPKTSKQSKRNDNLQNIASPDEVYDYLIIGTGMSALTAACLLSNSGKKVLMLEAHKHPGGMAHTFERDGYKFCAQVHYIWGCAPGGRVYEFLKKIGLDKEITFQLLNRDGYDRMVMPDGKAVLIPNGFDRLAEHIDQAYPGQKENVLKFTSILKQIRAELRKLPDRKIKWWEMILKAHTVPTLLKYKNKTLQDVFDECKLSKEAQAVLIANAGDMMAPPKDLSIFCYAGLFSGYNSGAYYPTKHFSHFLSTLAKFVTDHGGAIHFKTEVTNIEISDDKKVACVKTKDGKTYSARNFICNMDPQKASHMIGRQHFPKSYLKRLDYRYSPSGMMIYLGLKGIDLKKLGFGKFNTWHLEQWDMNTMWDEQGAHNFDKPWIFISTPSLHTKDRGTTPKGGDIMEIATYTEYSPFRTLQDKSYDDYLKSKTAISERLLDIVEKKYVPGLRKHIVVKCVGTPITHERFCRAPNGNAYGSYLNPEQIGLGRLKADTPFKNLWWCNASSGFAGIHGTISTGMDLYMSLTGDRFFDPKKLPTDDEFVARIWDDAKKD